MSTDSKIQKEQEESERHSVPFPTDLLKIEENLNQSEKSSQRSKKSRKSQSVRTTQKEIVPPQKNQREHFTKVTYISYVFASTLLPLLNLFILFTQSYNLSWEDNFASIDRQNFEYYYMGIGYYLASIVIFLAGSGSTYLNFKQVVKMFVLFDTNQICVIASNICYISLHLIYLCRDLAGNSYNIKTIDIIYLVLFTINNFAFMGYFRISLVVYRWTVVQTLTFKILVFTSSLSYFAYGILLIVGEDNLSTLLDQAKSVVQNFIQSTDFGNLGSQVQSELLQQMNNLSDNISVIQNLISLFVFTSFANICEVLSRMNDFDKSSELQPHYEIDDQEEEEDQKPQMQNFKNQINSQFKNILAELKDMSLMKNALQQVGSSQNFNTALSLQERASISPTKLVEEQPESNPESKKSDP